MNRQADYSQKVFDKYEQSIIKEEERKQNALWNTEESKVNFLQRLEQQTKEKELDHKMKFDNVAERNQQVKGRQHTEKKRVQARRKTVENKYKIQDTQVKLAKDRSQSQI